MKKPRWLKTNFSIAVLCFSLALPLAGGAQKSEGQASGGPSEIDIDHKVSRPKIAIAVPDCYLEGNQEALVNASKVIHDVIRDDLEWSGVFSVVSPEYYKLVPDHDWQSVPYHEWASIGSELMLHLTTMVEKGQLAVEGRLFEVRKEQALILAKRYRGDFEIARKIAHTLSDMIVEKLTGVKGVAHTRIAFISTRDGSKEVYLADYDGWNQRRITHHGTINISPDWSPDNEMIAYTSYLRGNPDIYLMSKHGARNTALAHGEELYSTPAWSPDGGKLAFTSSVGGDTEIWVIKKDGSGLTRLTVSPGIDTSPAWSSTGREIAFTSERSGSVQIWIMDADGLNLRQFTRTGSFNDSAAWSPDGSRIVYLARFGQHHDLMMYDLQSQQTKRLTNDAGNNETPSWSPDGRQILFDSDRSGTWQLYSMHADGTHLRQLTRRGSNTSPDWSN